MGLLSYNEIKELIATGVVTDVPEEHINGASIEVTLGDCLLVEANRGAVVDLAKKQTINTSPVTLTSYQPYIDIYPKQVVLAETREKFYLPADIVAEYTLKSSMARNFLEHLHAGYCDPTWNNAVLTMEFCNLSEFHVLRLTRGMKIGQIKLYRVEPVPPEKSYAKVGQYNNQDSVVVKGVR